jgi:hypothetical protein
LTHNYHRLIELWRKCPLNQSSFILPEDKAKIPEEVVSIFRSLDEYTLSSTLGQRDDTSLHVGLLPVPYVGNLQKASVFILMLNPGLSPGDYFAEYKVAQFREAHIRNLLQENTNDEFPFLFLNPCFAWHPGFGYWQGKLDDIAQALAKQERILYWEALRRLAQEMACLELMPYHSKSFGADRLLKKLPSVRAMLEYVNDILIPKAKTNEVTIVATRGAQYWDLPQHENIVVFGGHEARAAHLNLKSRGGKAIANQLGLKSQTE